jgi:hypothetical protein
VPASRPLVILNGGTGDLPPAAAAGLRAALADGLARVVAGDGLTLLTGGTEAGIIALVGLGLAAAGGAARCLGVAPSELVTWPGRPRAPAGATPLEPNHSHFVLVEGDAWGAETATMFALAGELAAGAPSVAVIANGGAVTRDEALANLRQERPLVVLAGSGRFADRLAALARRRLDPADEVDARLARARGITVMDLSEGAGGLVERVRRALTA